MKKAIIMPIILALGVGMSFAAKEHVQIDTLITVSDGTLFSQALRKGSTSTSITGGDVTYTQTRCVNGVCAELAPDTTSKFFTPTYSWEKRDINSGEWSAYEDGTFNDNGEYRLRVDYKHVFDGVVAGLQAEALIKRLSYDRYGCGVTDKKNIFDTVKVNGILFSDLGLCRNSYTRTLISKNQYFYVMFAIRSFVSPAITVGKAYSIVLKPFCTDGSNKCKAEYTGPAKSYEGDSVKFTVKNTNEDYGWGVPPTTALGSLLPVCNPDSSSFSVERCYAMSANLSAYIPINPTKKTLDSLYYLIGNSYASLDMNSYESIESILMNNLPYRFSDKTDGIDTIYYPLTKRDISINYDKYENGAVTGPKKAHDGELMLLKIVPDDGYDLDKIYSRGYDENNEIKYNAVQPEVSDMLENGSRIALFMAQKGFEQNIYADFKKVGQEVSMLKPTNGTYSVFSRTKEHPVSEKSFVTNAAGTKIAVHAVPDKGYAVKSVTCSYVSRGEGTVTNDLMLGEDSLYSCAIPDTSELSKDILDRTKQISIVVTFAKESKIDIDVTGRGTVTAYIKGSVDANGNYTKGYCSSNPTETAGKACTALDGDSILIEVEDSEGHPLQQLSCKNGTTTNCKDSKTFVMKAVDAQIVAIFDALNYALTKTGDHADDFDLYVGWGSKTPATQAHEFDTVYVKSKDGKHVVVPGNNSTDLTVTDPKTGVEVVYFIMPASDKEVHVDDDAYYSTVNLARKIVGKGTAIINIGSMVRTLEEGELIRVMKGNDFFSFVRSTPAEGYTYDSTRCYYGDSYSDSTEILLLQGGLHSGAFPVEFENDITCDVVFSPNTYKIAWTQADTNGFVQGVPEKGKTDESISFKVSPVADYEIDFVKAYYTEKDSSNKDVSVFLKLSNSYDKKKNTYTYKFSMPAHDVDVEVAFKEIKSSSSSAKAKSSSSSAKAKSSSSKAKAKSSSSSAKAKSSSSKAKAKSSSSKKKTILAVMAQVPQFSLFVNGRSMQIAGARVGSKMEVFDLQGHRVLSGNVDAVNFSVAMPRSGSYLVRIDGQTQNVNIK